MYSLLFYEVARQDYDFNAIKCVAEPRRDLPRFLALHSPSLGFSR